MISEGLKIAGVTHYLSTSASMPKGWEKHDLHVTHLFNEAYLECHDPVIVAVRNPLDMIGSWHFQIKSLTDATSLRNIIPDRLEDCFRNWVEKDLPWFRIEDEFHKLGEFVGTRVLEVRHPKKRHTRGDYWVKELIRDRDKETLWQILPLDFLARWVEKIPAYQTYDLWWME